MGDDNGLFLKPLVEGLGDFYAKLSRKERRSKCTFVKKLGELVSGMKEGIFGSEKEGRLIELVCLILMRIQRYEVNEFREIVMSLGSFYRQNQHKVERLLKSLVGNKRHTLEASSMVDGEDAAPSVRSASFNDESQDSALTGLLDSHSSSKMGGCISTKGIVSTSPANNHKIDPEIQRINIIQKARLMVQIQQTFEALTDNKGAEEMLRICDLKDQEYITIKERSKDRQVFDIPENPVELYTIFSQESQEEDPLQYSDSRGRGLVKGSRQWSRRKYFNTSTPKEDTLRFRHKSRSPPVLSQPHPASNQLRTNKSRIRYELK